MAIHKGFACDGGSRASAVPICQTVSYAYNTAQALADAFAGRSPGYIYTRIANPTITALETRLTELEDGIGCIATSSGMAAIASVVIGLAGADDHIVAATGIFGGTVSLFENTLARFGIKTTLVDTVTKPILFKPGEFGADIVVHLTLKFINGHGTAIGGAIIDTGNYNWRKEIFEDIKADFKQAIKRAFKETK